MRRSTTRSCGSFGWTDRQSARRRTQVAPLLRGGASRSAAASPASYQLPYWSLPLRYSLTLAAHPLADGEDAAGHLEHAGELIGLLEEVADRERAVPAQHDEVVLLEPRRQQLGDLRRSRRELGLDHGHLVEQVRALRVDRHDLVLDERLGDRVGRMGVDDGERRRLLVDRAVHDDLRRGQGDVGVVLLKADVDDVALRQLRKHGAATRDEDAVALAHAHVAAVRADRGRRRRGPGRYAGTARGRRSSRRAPRSHGRSRARSPCPSGRAARAWPPTDAPPSSQPRAM